MDRELPLIGAVLCCAEAVPSRTKGNQNTHEYADNFVTVKCPPYHRWALKAKRRLTGAAAASANISNDGRAHDQSGPGADDLWPRIADWRRNRDHSLLVDHRRLADIASPPRHGQSFEVRGKGGK